ncbi:MAG: ABC transporter permease [Puia sp.]
MSFRFKLNPGDPKTTISHAEAAWKKYFPQLPFEYKFLDDDFNSQYTADQKTRKILCFFFCIDYPDYLPWAFGTHAFTTQQKQKEISIRRVMGASILQVVTLTTRNYLWLALIAACIAFPVAWFSMNKWLHIFPYNDGLSVIPFILSALVIVVTASATATFHSAKAAITSPAIVLKTE